MSSGPKREEGLPFKNEKYFSRELEAPVNR
jgi:hypothetical protein